MGVKGYLHAAATVCPVKDPLYPLTGSWVGAWPGLNIGKREKLLAPTGNQTMMP